MKIRTKLFCTILAIFSSLLLAGYLAHRNEKQALTDQIHNHLLSVASLQQARLSNIVAQNFERLQLVASRTQLRISLKQFLLDGRSEHLDRMHLILTDARNSIPSLKNIDILHSDGRILASTSKKAIGTIRPRGKEKCFLGRHEGESRIDLFVDPEDGLILHLCGPLYLEGEFLGIVALDSQATALTAAVQDYDGLGETGETLVVTGTDNGGAIFLTPTRFDTQAALQRTIPPSAVNSPSLQSLRGGDHFFPEAVDYRVELVQAASRIIEKTDWVVLVKFDHKETFAPLLRLRMLLLVIFCGFTLLIIAAMLFLARSITLPLARLTAKAKSISRGETVPAEIPSDNEIDLLADAFNDMTNKLAMANAELVANNEILAKIFSTTHVLLAYMDKDFRFIRVNEAYAAAYGQQPDAFSGKNYFAMFPDPKREALFRQVVASCRPYNTFADTFVGYPGRDDSYWDWTLHPILDAAGKTEGVFFISKDATERKLADEERNASLLFFESLDRINRATQGTDSLEQMMSNVLDEMLTIFECDRAFLMYPCDPDAKSWSCPMERTKPDYPGILELGLEMPMDPEIAEGLRILLDTNTTMKVGPGNPYPLPQAVAKRFGIRSYMSMALHPKVGKPWQFGIHQCSRSRIWTSEEERIFQEIGRRLGDALTSLLVDRDLRQSEKRFSTLVNQAADAFFVHDVEGRFLDVNRTACENLGYTREELLEMSVANVDAEFTSHDHVKNFWSKLTPDHPVTLEGRHKRKDGTTFPVEIRLGLLQLEDRQVCLALARDITARKSGEETLRQLNEELEARVRKRTVELEAKNEELERMNQLFVGRELRMMELKERIKKLEMHDRPHGNKVAKPDA
ncbi:MAG: PAS domain S-box protein [Desulfobulbaceae bacterium]|nr:PAS domain S-box protein [Desulfobulbaceae bacterium]